MKGRLSRTVTLFFIVIGVIGARAAQQTAPDSPLFKDSVAAIFEQNCNSCHGARMQRSGLDLRTEAAILKGGARGPAVIPGEPAKSLLYRLVTHAEEPHMPIGRAKLSDADSALIARWIEAMPKPAAAAATESAPVRAPGYSIGEKDRQFWAFVKPARPSVPRLKTRPGYATILMPLF